VEQGGAAARARRVVRLNQLHAAGYLVIDGSPAKVIVVDKATSLRRDDRLDAAHHGRRAGDARDFGVAAPRARVKRYLNL
jgi:hypothetical protein